MTAYSVICCARLNSYPLGFSKPERNMFENLSACILPSSSTGFHTFTICLATTASI